MLKVELHAHTDEDPADRIAHSCRELVDRAASLAYHVVAVTLHDRYFDPARENGYARERGVLLLSGVERTIGRSHLLLINFPRDCETVRSFDDVARLKSRHPGLVVAPHPFYPTPSALGARLLDRHADLFDAVEVNAMYVRGFDFNRQAIAWARENRKPVVGNTDLHLLDQMGTTYSLVDAAANPDAVCDAIRAGRVEVRTEPLSPVRAATWFTRMCWGGLKGHFPRKSP